MANTVPTQERVVDPFASYNSNVVNRITEIVTHNDEGMLTPNSLQVTLDSTSPTTTVVVGTGYAIKDDVLIRITAEHSVDFTDDDNWVTPPNAMTFTGGYCYLVLEYQYLKQRPAPQASIKILQPDERTLITPGSVYLLLKVVEVDSTLPATIINIYDYDPAPDQTNERLYIKYYAGAVVNIPTYSQTVDQGRIAYETTRDRFYFGHASEWRELTAGGVAVDVNTDTTGITLSSICYVDSNEQAQLSISTSIYTQAEFVTTGIGTKAAGTGRGIIAGYVESVPVEASIIITAGDILYLSETEAGKVTNVRPTTHYQIVGRALEAGNSSVGVKMIFSPKMILTTSEAGNIPLVTGWTFDGTNLYYHDIDVSNLDGSNAFDCHWFDADTRRELHPPIVEIRNNGDVIRVYFYTNTYDVNYMIQSPVSTSGSGGGGGGSGGTSDHSLLLNLGYGASGHTGFMSDTPHDNTYHSQTYITSASVTYGTLDTNGDVGGAAGQLAIGDHTHTLLDTHSYVDIPSGTTILIESDTAITGYYNLLATQDDMLVYITKGSAAGGETGGTTYSSGTWTQPAHTHGISSESSHRHTTGSHTLTVSEMPAHTHDAMDGSGGSSTNSITLGGGNFSGQNASLTWRSSSTYTLIRSTGGGNSHNHGNTGYAGGHNHTGTTGSTSAGGSSWRPRGLNYTRQQRI